MSKAHCSAYLWLSADLARGSVKVWVCGCVGARAQIECFLLFGSLQVHVGAPSIGECVLPHAKHRL